MSKSLKGFITYSHKDTEAKDELITRLAVMKQQNELITWHDNEMLPSDKWREEIFSTRLPDSDLLLYLVSAASLASENCNKELGIALKKNMKPIPIILEDCDWKKHQLGEFQALPDKGNPINEWHPESKGWQNVVDGIRKFVDAMQSQTDSSSGTSEKELRAELAFQQGNFLMTLRQIDKAIEAYSRAIELNPNYAYAYNNRGIAYGQKGEFDRAIADFDKAIEISSRYAEAYSNRGVAYSGKGEFDRAIEDYNTAIELNPNYADAYNNRGSTYRSQGEFDHAIVNYAKAIALKPKYVEAYYNRGATYGEKGDVDCAVEDYTKAIALKPNFAEAYNSRGNAYRRKGEFDRAIEDLDKAIETISDYADAYNSRGNAYKEKGEFDRAIEDYNTAISLKSDYAEAYSNRGLVYYSQGDYDRAIANYTEAIGVKSDYAEAYYNRGLVYYSQGDYDRAIEDYNTAIGVKPDYAEAYSNRGVVYSSRGEFDRAIVDYNTAIDLKPKLAEAYTNRGNGYNNKGDYDRAIVDLDRAIDLKPDDVIAYYNRGLAYERKGDYDRAIANYTEAIGVKPDYAEAYYNRGVVYYSQGDYDRAIEDYNTAIGVKPDYAEAYSNRGVVYSSRGEFDRAIVDYNTAIDLKPKLAEAYTNRGVVYYSQGDYDRAIVDYTKAIELQPKLAEAHYNRGETWLYLGEWEEAKSDLMAAKNMGVDIIAAFCNDYKNVSDFERRNRVKLPEDIAPMLTQRRRSRFPKTEKFLSSDGTPFESPDVLNLLAELRGAGTPLSQYVQTRPTFGLRIGGGGAFVVDSVTRDQLIAEHPSSTDILKPFLHGRDIRRWQIAKPGSWLIFAYRRIEINRYPAIRKHLEKYRSSLRKRAGKQKWYELPASKSDAELFTQTKLICPNRYDHQTFAVDTEGFYCGDTCYLIPTEETWLCGLLNSRAVEWFYSQVSNQLTGDYLQARSRYMQQISVPDLTSGQKSQIGKIVDYLIYLQGQPTTNSGDLAHARDFIMLRYFERIIDGLVYESYLGEELHHGGKQFFKPLLDEGLPQLEEIRGDKMAALQEIFERLYERTHPIRRNLFFLDSVKPIRIIEGKA